MRDEEQEVWAEELLKLVEQENQRADHKIQQLKSSNTESGPVLPDRLGIQDPRSLLRQHAGDSLFPKL